MANLYIGIDPGKTGGFTVLNHQLEILKIGVFNEPEVIQSFNMYRFGNAVGVIERQKAFPGQGATAGFSLGDNFGWWRGVCQSNSLRHSIVVPVQWQKDLHFFRPEWMEKDQWDKNRKEYLRFYARDRFPDSPVWDGTLSFQRAVCDSMLIAWHCWRKENGKSVKSLSKARRTVENLRLMHLLSREE